ncbi:GntR family transcriptional regulator [Candidatus Latescibacterota bacterium]
MSTKLDPTRPIYIQIMEEIKKRAVRGQYKAGEQLPSVRELAREIGVNPNTIARVYMELERDEFIFIRRGQGSFVTEDTTRVAEERKRFADNAVEKFILEIGELQLNGGHRKKILDSIADEFTKNDENNDENTD